MKDFPGHGKSVPPFFGARMAFLLLTGKSKDVRALFPQWEEVFHFPVTTARRMLRLLLLPASKLTVLLFFSMTLHFFRPNPAGKRGPLYRRLVRELRRVRAVSRSVPTILLRYDPPFRQRFFLPAEARAPFLLSYPVPLFFRHLGLDPSFPRRR